VLRCMFAYSSQTACLQALVSKIESLQNKILGVRVFQQAGDQTDEAIVRQTLVDPGVFYTFMDMAGPFSEHLEKFFLSVE
jgi:hypothetical protein